MLLKMLSAVFLLLSLAGSVHGFQSSFSVTSQQNGRSRAVVMQLGDTAVRRRNFIAMTGCAALLSLPKLAGADDATDAASPATGPVESPPAESPPAESPPARVTDSVESPPADLASTAPTVVPAVTDVPIDVVSPSSGEAAEKSNGPAGILAGLALLAGFSRTGGPDSAWKNNYYNQNSKALKQGQTPTDAPQGAKRVEGRPYSAFNYQSDLSNWKTSAPASAAEGEAYVMLTDAQLAAYGEPSKRKLTSV